MLKVYVVIRVYLLLERPFMKCCYRDQSTKQLLEEPSLPCKDQMACAPISSLAKDYQGLIRQKSLI